MSTTHAIVFVLSAVTTLAMPPQASDAKGAKDHALVKRYEGSTILQAKVEKYGEYVVPLGPAVRQGNTYRLAKTETIEGSVTRITYVIPPDRSALEVIRNYEGELKAAGYKVVFQAADQALGVERYSKDQFAVAAGYEKIPLPRTGWNLASTAGSDQRLLVARLDRPQGPVHVVAYASTRDETFAKLVFADETGRKYMVPGQVILQLDVIESKPMETRMVTVDADEMSKAITAAGSVALYGIYFDTNSAELKAESNATIAEIARLLKAQPALKLLVVGHTDNVGTFQANQDLSQRRAAAVVKALSAAHGIDGRRLTPVGVSFASPVASNRTEEGRAKNRRVQLVEQ